MGYEYILFDLDGTLTDSGIGITNSVMYALQKYGIEVTDRSQLYKFVGPPLLDSFEKFYGFSKEVGINSIGVLFGYGDRNELEKAGVDFIVDTVEDIGKVLFI